MTRSRAAICRWVDERIEVVRTACGMRVVVWVGNNATFEARKGSHLRMRGSGEFPHPEVPALLRASKGPHSTVTDFAKFLG